MTKEQIKLLLDDLSLRLQTGVICRVNYKENGEYRSSDMVLAGLESRMPTAFFLTKSGSIYSSDFKPYLRPLSDMTKEEALEYNSIKWLPKETTLSHIDEDFLINIPNLNQLNWLIEHGFDFNGLIEQDLAIASDAETCSMY